MSQAVRPIAASKVPSGKRRSKGAPPQDAPPQDTPTQDGSSPEGLSEWELACADDAAAEAELQMIARRLAGQAGNWLRCPRGACRRRRTCCGPFPLACHPPRGPATEKEMEDLRKVLREHLAGLDGGREPGDFP
ncbi:hypothetical protein SLNSH_22675 [Alsobacter soli]|uniref:Uncharacterized protein n=1 Tax=Alsobacter soli TaxID=2109933 RepID=A0A2T1HMB5_9HYPH|nr:hypothetical protein [Alsobacter soli]PSC02731.1 hypothetical protein SLNSH_22675 [Alsobacter soli]